MTFVNGSNPQVKPDLKERVLKGEVDTVAVEKWERETHKGHVASLVSMFRHGGVYDGHDAYKMLANKGVNVLVILGEKDGVIEAGPTEKELLKLGWTGEIKVIEGATHEIIRTHAGDVVGLVKPFWESLAK
jgi:pimeloyl-ACP methyl ester carboxylesterase